MSEDKRTLANFGGNQRWQPRRSYRPRSEQEVLDILSRHRSERIRAIGSLHSWSEVAVAPDVLLDMGEFVEVEPRAAAVRSGAGCRLGDLLDRLHAATDQTLPTLGVIRSQTIAGAISTGTHGSGRQTLSHFVTAVRFAAYSPSGEPKVFEYGSGDELKAARCGLGAVGVILAVEMRTVPKYSIRDTVRILARVEDARALCDAHELSQFALAPYGWKIMAWERDVISGTAPGARSLRARAFRVLNFVGVDVLCHLLVKAARALGAGAVRMLMKILPGLLIANVPRIDDAEHVLTMRHDLFRHEEMEVFVPRSRLVEAASLVRGAIEMFAGAASPPADLEAMLRKAGLYDDLMQHRGMYLHHYPLFFRHVLPDDTLVSMTSASSEPWYSISFFTYDSPGNRGRYYAFCAWIAHALHANFGARLHWGKHYPLGAAEAARMYPNLEQFRMICRATDRGGVFRNDFTDKVVGFR